MHTIIGVVKEAAKAIVVVAAIWLQKFDIFFAQFFATRVPRLAITSFGYARLRTGKKPNSKFKWTLNYSSSKMTK